MPQGLVEAYKWYSLAAKEGRVTTSSRNSVAQQLTPNQIAETERLVAKWKPNPAECEIEAASHAN